MTPAQPHQNCSCKFSFKQPKPCNTPCHCRTSVDNLPSTPLQSPHDSEGGHVVEVLILQKARRIHVTVLQYLNEAKRHISATQVGTGFSVYLWTDRLQPSAYWQLPRLYL